MSRHRRKARCSITNAATGAFTYTPNAGAVGYDTFVYRAADATGGSNAMGSVFIVTATPTWPGSTARASVANDGSQLTTPSSFGALSNADGRFIVFTSGVVDEATLTLPGIFVRDRQTGETTLISRATGSDVSIGGIFPAISADGRFIVFSSLASALPGGHPSVHLDLYLHDRMTGQTERVSVSSAGTSANSDTVFASLSADGRYVAFSSTATNLAPGDTDDDNDVYVRDRQLGTTTLVSVSSAGVKGDSGGWLPTFSADGRFVSFNSESTNLVPNDTNGQVDLFVRDLLSNQTTRVSVGTGGTQANSDSNSLGALSADGRFALFDSDASNLVVGDTNGLRDVFVHDRQTGQTTRVSVSSTGAQADGDSGASTLSADGRYVLLGSSATNLVPGDTNGLPDVFVHDRQTGQTVRVNVASDGTQANAVSVGDDDGCCAFPTISADGRSVMVVTLASSLVPGDTNGLDDVFVVGPVSVGPTTVDVPGHRRQRHRQRGIRLCRHAMDGDDDDPVDHHQRAGRRIGERSRHLHRRAQYRRRRQDRHPRRGAEDDHGDAAGGDHAPAADRAVRLVDRRQHPDPALHASRDGSCPDRVRARRRREPR